MPEIFRAAEIAETVGASLTAAPGATIVRGGGFGYSQRSGKDAQAVKANQRLLSFSRVSGRTLAVTRCVLRVSPGCLCVRIDRESRDGGTERPQKLIGLGV